MNFLFFINAILLGTGLAMDAFSVSLANGLNEPQMKKNKMSLIAGTFALFQIFMPLIGWYCVHSLVEKFKQFEKFIPWIALILLAYIGGKMLIEGLNEKEKKENNKSLSYKDLFIQGIATSIDALSVGFTIAELNFPFALIEALIIGLTTFFICIIGLILGQKFGTKLENKASILGGLILITIGIEIFLKGIL